MVTHHTDNKATYFIVRYGSSKTDLQELALQTFLACRGKNIELKVEWRRRSEEEMEDADEGSRGPWSLSEEFMVDQGQGRPNPNPMSAKLHRFATKIAVRDSFALGLEQV